MEANTGYVLISVEDWAILTGLDITALNQLLDELFKYDAANGVYYAPDDDRLYEFFFESDYAEQVLDYYNGGWYLRSTKWVQEV